MVSLESISFASRLLYAPNGRIPIRLKPGEFPYGACLDICNANVAGVQIGQAS